MALNTTDMGTVVSAPIRLVPQGRASIVTTNKSKLVATPVSLMRETFTSPSTIDDDGFVTAVAGANATTASLTLGGALCSGGVGTNAIPRAVTVTVTHGSSIVAQTFTVTGTDVYGRTIGPETLTITATGTSKTATTLQAYKTVTAATQTAAGDASANTVKLGDSKVLGLAYKCDTIVPIGELEDGVTPTAGVLVRASTTANQDYRGTYTPNSTLNGSKTFIVSYISTDPTVVGP